MSRRDRYGDKAHPETSTVLTRGNLCTCPRVAFGVGHLDHQAVTCLQASRHGSKLASEARGWHGDRAPVPPPMCSTPVSPSSRHQKCTATRTVACPPGEHPRRCRQCSPPWVRAPRSLAHQVAQRRLGRSRFGLQERPSRNPRYQARISFRGPCVELGIPIQGRAASARQRVDTSRPS